MNRQWVTFAALSAAVCLAAGCESRLGNPVIVEESGQTLTVLDGSALNTQDQLAAKRIDRLEGIAGIEWISDREIGFIKPVKTGGDEQQQPTYSSTTGIRDVLSGAVRDEKPWNGTETRLLSPDGKHAYVVTTSTIGENIYGKHAIENTENGQLKPVDLEAVSGQKLWIDHEHLIYIAGIGEGGVVQADLEGRVTPMPELTRIFSHQDTKYAENPVKVGDRLYYQESDYPNGVHNLNYIQLSQLDKAKVATVMKDVARYAPSPDGKTIAILKNNPSSSASQQELFLINPDGQQSGSVIAKGIVIDRMAWSPDSSKLAYGVSGNGGGGYQIYVLDLKSGKPSQVFECKRLDGDILWSPSGKQLLVPSNRSDSGIENLPVTNIIQFN